MSPPSPESPQQEHGASGFSEAYWAVNYAHPEQMEGIANAREHVRYLQSFFALEEVEVESLADFGCGLGHLLQELVTRFRPDRAWAIEPSSKGYEATRKRKLDPYGGTDIQLQQQDLLSWCLAPVKEPWDTFDLGVCTSVFQYLSDDELEAVLPVLAERCAHLYLTVPTDRELRRQREQVGFHDPYAISRSRTQYLRHLRPHFCVIGNRLLQSRRWYDEQDSPFTDLLFRF